MEDLSKKVKDLSGRLSAHRGSSDSVGGGSSTYAGGLQVSTSAEGYQEVTMSSSEGMWVVCGLSVCNYPSVFADNSSTGTRSNSIKKGFIQTTKDWVYKIVACTYYIYCIKCVVGSNYTSCNSYFLRKLCVFYDNDFWLLQ